MKYTIGWELDRKKAPILWEKYGYRFPRPSTYHGFCSIFPYCGKFMGKPIHFSYAEVYHRMGIGWEKSTILWEKDEYRFPRLSPYHGFCCIFPYCGKFMEKPCISPHMMTSVNFFLWNKPMLFEDSSNVFLLRLLKSVISVKYFTSFNSSNMLLNIYLLIKNLIIKPFVLLTNIRLTRTKTLVNNLWKFWWNSNLEHKLRIFEIVILNTKWKKLQIPLTLV